VLLLWVQLLSKSLDQIKDEAWFTECGDAFVKHIPLYTAIPDEKVSNFHRWHCVISVSRHKCISHILSCTQKKVYCINAYLSRWYHLDLVIAIHYIRCKRLLLNPDVQQYKALQYMIDCCVYTSDIARRQHLWSAGCRQLLIPRHHRSMFGRRAFSVASPAAWNLLPDFEIWQFSSWPENSFFLVLLAYTVH